MQCENQVKRTSVAMGQAHPVWKEEVTFKSVQITSDLQVSTITNWTSCHSASSASAYASLPMPNSIQHTFTDLLLPHVCIGWTARNQPTLWT